MKTLRYPTPVLPLVAALAALSACSSPAGDPSDHDDESTASAPEDLTASGVDTEVALPGDEPPGPDMAPTLAAGALEEVGEGVGHDPAEIAEVAELPDAPGAGAGAVAGERPDELTGVPGDLLGAQDPANVPLLEGAPGLATSRVESIKCAYIQWWDAPLTYRWYTPYAWYDTDLRVRAWTPVQLRHASRLVAWGVYGWGYVPTFIDTVTGYRFRFLHLHPTAKRATWLEHVYPSGYVVGYSGGNTYDTGYPRYSSGAHLCVNTRSPYRSAFPYGYNRCY